MNIYETICFQWINVSKLVLMMSIISGWLRGKPLGLSKATNTSLSVSAKPLTFRITTLTHHLNHWACKFIESSHMNKYYISPINESHTSSKITTQKTHGVSIPETLSAIEKASTISSTKPPGQPVPGLSNMSVLLAILLGHHQCKQTKLYSMFIQLLNHICVFKLCFWSFKLMMILPSHELLAAPNPPGLDYSDTSKKTC